MSLQIGRRFGSYQITSLLGKGGMGEVYRARDTRLDRSVAIKTLPEQFESDAERLARFEREAKVLASLNHPNIGAIYGLEKHDGRHILVLELVEGQTLADLVARGPMPLDESLRLAVQIAEALQAAHEKGVIHRDLKPANIKITRDGTVKVFDFGLAKAREVESSDGDGLSNSPTLRTLASTPGMILGTAAYMSPEQAKGRHVDRRTDIFAFGCVLYEMLTGKRAFEGEDVSDTLAAVLRAEPNWSALPEEVSPGLRTLIQRCLAKDRTKRVAEMSAAKLVLSEPDFMGSAGASAVASTTSSARSRLTASSLLLIAALILTVGGALVWLLRTPQVAPAVVRFSVRLPDGLTFANVRLGNIDISPDGARLVYAATDRANSRRLYSQSLSDFDAKAISGSETKLQISNPTFSPDGQWIAFSGDQTIKRIPVNGGTPMTIAPALSPGVSIGWNLQGLLFGQSAYGISRVSPNGSAPLKIVTLQDEAAFEPRLLPDGNAVLFTLTKGRDEEQFDSASVVIQSLATGARTPIVDGSGGRYLPTGHLIYTLSGTVFAAPFDLKQRKVTGEAVPVLQGVRRRPATGGAELSVSQTGTLAYVPGPATFSAASRMLIITDRNGTTTPVALPPGPYSHPRMSRDAKHVAVAVDERRDAYIAIYDISSAAALRRLTFEGKNQFPVWSGDSQWIAFQSDREGDLGIFMQRADGSSGKAERLTKPEPGVAHVPESWSPDGQTLIFSEKRDATFSLWMLTLDTRKITPFGKVQSAVPTGAAFSPDGRWVAYTLVTRGTSARGGGLASGSGVYVEPFPPTSARYQVPKEFIDFHPAWGTTSAELFYIPSAIRLSVIPIRTQPNFSFGKAVTLPKPPTNDRINGDTRDYDVMPDGRFISSVPASDEGASGSDGARQIRVVLNWFTELQQRVPVK
jgi:serine/threonine-protein kinase